MSQEPIPVATVDTPSRARPVCRREFCSGFGSHTADAITRISAVGNDMGASEIIGVRLSPTARGQVVAYGTAIWYA
ncbi:hypothetical protein ACIQM4_18150 [Streptomyces sp. NPDC091272]|uniref:hypothetical protein n=1 Tax=Streptomyces sp. NPDC091272 TaxID=3365981 RepID=UPI0037FCD04E